MQRFKESGNLCSDKGWEKIFKTRFECALHVSTFIFLYSLFLSFLLSSPTPRQRRCCGDGDGEAYHTSHIPVVPAASGGLHGTTALQEV